ncbi:Protein stoned-A, partial [Gryllus bimaculatus]
ERPDLLDLPAEGDATARPLTPAASTEAVADDADPFDTSIAEQLLPGRAELRLIESEILGQ